MICASCSEAGTLNSLGQIVIAGVLHAGCKYPKSCTCQHRVGEGNVSEEAKRSREGNSVSHTISTEGGA